MNTSLYYREKLKVKYQIKYHFSPSDKRKNNEMR